MPDGSDWNVRGELGSLPDGMVASQMDLLNTGSSVIGTGSIDNIEHADCEHEFRDRSRKWHHCRKNSDLHGFQIGIKSYPVHLRSKEPTNQNSLFYIDNKLIDDNKVEDLRVKKGILLAKETDADKGVKIHDRTVGEITKTRTGSRRRNKKYLTSLNGRQNSANIKESTTKEGSLNVVNELKKTGKELDGKKMNVKYEVNKEQSEKLAKWKVTDSEELEKNDEDIPEKVTVPGVLHTKHNFNLSLKEMDKNKSDGNRKLSCYVEEEQEETLAKTTLDCLSEDVGEKYDSSKDYLSLGFTVTNSERELSQHQSDCMEECYEDSGRALEETSWCNSVESIDHIDSGLTKLSCDTERECSMSGNYEKDKPVEYDTWSDRSLKSGVVLHVDNRDLEELRKSIGSWIKLTDEGTFTPNWLETAMKTGHITWRTSDLKNHYRSFLNRQAGGHELMDSKRLDRLIQFEIEKLLSAKTSSNLLSSGPQNVDKCFEEDKNVADSNRALSVSNKEEQYDTTHDAVNVSESMEVDCDESSDAALTSISNAEDMVHVNHDDDGVVEGDMNELDDTAGLEAEIAEISDVDTEDILDADEKDSGVSEKKNICPGKTTVNEIEKDVGFPTAVNDMKGNGDKVLVHCAADEVNSCIDEAIEVVRESGRKKIDSLKAAKLILPALYKLQMQVMELQMKVDKLDTQIGMDKFKLDVERKNYLLCFNVQDNWDQVFSFRRRTACRYPGTSSPDCKNFGSWFGEEHIHSTFHTRNQRHLARKMPKPKVPNSDQFIPKHHPDRRGVGLLCDCKCIGRQCADNGSNQSGRGSNAGDKGNSGDKDSKNRKNEEDKNSHRSNNNNNNNNDKNNSNNNNSSHLTPGMNNVVSSLESQAAQPGRSLDDVHVPDNDYKAYRKKKHKAQDDYEWLEKINNKLLENGGPSFNLFTVLTNNEDVCLEVCLSRPGDISEEDFQCTMCLTVDSLLKHFTNCHSNFNSCDMCVKFFSLLCSHVTLCISRNGTVECDIDICRTVIKMIPSANIESHVKTLWFQVRKKFARIIGIVELEEQMAEIPEKPMLTRKSSLVRKPSGPLPSIPEMSVIPNTTFSNSAVIRRRISQMRIHGEGDTDSDDDTETVDYGASRNVSNVDLTGSGASSISRPEVGTESDAMPTSSEDGSLEDSSGHSAVGKGFVSLPPAGPPCVGDTYFPSFQDRPRGIRGIGEVVYADRNQMLVVVTVWEKFKTQFLRESKLAKHYREEGVILLKFRNKLKINQLRYQTDFQWVKSVHLGNGMTGKCHLAKDFETGFKFCVKEIHISNYEKDEIELMSALDHEYIVQVYGAIRHAEKIYILQEFIEGGSLTEAINIQKKLGRRLSQLTALRYFEQLLKVLVYLKKHNILNEDIKSDNILLDRNIDDASGSSSIKVADFGMARRCQGSVQSGTKPVGTQTQWSPEKAEAVGYGYPAELWAAICVLVHMLSGLPPWVRRFEEMKALILVIVDKSPPMEDIPRNILETIQDLIRRGFTVSQGQRPTAEELLNHPAFQLLGENSNPNGIYSILESVHYPSQTIADATNSIEDDLSADRRELHRKGVTDYGGASKSGVPNLGFEIPAEELSIYPAAPSNGEAGAASNTRDGATNRTDESIENTDIRYELYLLETQSKNEHADNSQTPISAQPSIIDPFHSYLHNEFPVNQNLPDFSIYQPSQIDYGQETENVNTNPEQITEEEVTSKLIPDFDKILASDDNQSSKSGGNEKKTGDDWIHDPEQALAHVIQNYTSPGSNHGDQSDIVRAVSGGMVGGSGENGDGKVLGDYDVGSDEEAFESISSNISDDDLLASDPTENYTKKNKRKSHSDADLWHLPKGPNSRNQPQSAPPYLIPSTDPRVLVTQPSGVNNQIPAQSHLLPGTGNHTVDASGRPYSVVYPPHSMQQTHHSPRNPGPVSPHSMTNYGMQNFMTSTPAYKSNQQMGTRPNQTASHPRELFSVDNNTPRQNPTGPVRENQFYNPSTNARHPTSLDYHKPRQDPSSFGGGNQFYHQSMYARPPTSVAQQQYLEHSYRQAKISQLQPKTPILNPVINPKAWPTLNGTRIPNQQLDIKKAQQGTDSPISHVQTAPAFSPPKTPKKSPDFYRAQSEVPIRRSKPSCLTPLGSSPNDQLSTSTTRSQFEEQDLLLKELARTAEDALSQHSDPVHWQLYASPNEEDEEDDRNVMGELDDEIIEDPAKSFAHLFDDNDVSITITFRSNVNDNETKMKFTSKYFNQSWRTIIKEALDGFSRHDMPREYGLTRFNLKLDGDFIDLDHCLGNESQILIMTEAMDNDPWWIERGMIY